MCHFIKRSHKDNHTWLPCMVWDWGGGMYTLLLACMHKTKQLLGQRVTAVAYVTPIKMASEPKALTSTF